MTEKVDSYRFLDGVTKKMVKTWIKLEPLPAQAQHTKAG